MTPKNAIRFLCLALLIQTVVTSCEGFKTLTVYNKTGQEITVQTSPELPAFKRTSFSDTTRVLQESREYKVPADSSLVLLAIFGPLFFKAKMGERDLATDYFKIITTKDTIVANSRTEILRLTKINKTKYVRKTDKHFAIDNNKNIEAIVVRQ